ncbi:MAG: hypothetical protein U0V04_19515 [Spirosomataceae bacterium]|jgi:hypothetical protein
MKNKSFKIKFADGNSIDLHLSSDNECVVTIDDLTSYKFQVNEADELSIVHELKVTPTNQKELSTAISSLEPIEYQKANDEEALLRTCINCNGRRYCITNGCANTPCGWICG